MDNDPKNPAFFELQTEETYWAEYTWDIFHLFHRLAHFNGESMHIGLCYSQCMVTKVTLILFSALNMLLFNVNAV